MTKLTQKRFPSARTIFLAFSAIVFVWMLILNCLTPYIADDFSFSYRFDTGERLSSMSGLFKSLIFHYFQWSGRFPAKFFAQLFTMMPKMVFNVANAAVYVLFGWVLYALATGRQYKKYDILLFLFIELALWEFSPAFGQANLWMCGACCYLWPNIICISFLLPWRFYLDKPFATTKKMTFGMAVAGVFAGWVSENVSAGVLVGIVLATGWVILLEKRPRAWMASGFLGMLVGYGLLILSPGNTVRSSQEVHDSRPLLTRLAVHFFDALNMLKDYALPLLLAFVALYVLLWLGKTQRQKLIWPAILFLSSMAANFAMIFSPVYYDRSTHGVFALLAAACVACLALLTNADFRRAVTVVAAAVSVVALIHMAEAGYDIASYYVMYTQREALILQAVENGETDVVTYGIDCYTKYCGAYGVPDIRDNGEDSIALARAKWYGLSGQLTANEVHTYPFPGHTNEAYEAGLKAAEQTNPSLG